MRTLRTVDVKCPDHINANGQAETRLETCSLPQIPVCYLMLPQGNHPKYTKSCELSNSIFEIKCEQPIISTNGHVFFITEISVENMYLPMGSDRFKNQWRKRVTFNEQSLCFVFIFVYFTNVWSQLDVPTKSGFIFCNKINFISNLFQYKNLMPPECLQALVLSRLLHKERKI